MHYIWLCTTVHLFIVFTVYSFILICYFPACKNLKMRCWHGYLSTERCKWFAYGPGDATATTLSVASLKSICLTFLVPAYPGYPGKEAVSQFCVLHLSFLWLPCIADVDIIFLPCGFFLSIFFSSTNLSSCRLDGCLPYTWCGSSANLEFRSEMCCTWLSGNAGHKKIAKKSPSEHHRTTLSR